MRKEEYENKRTALLNEAQKLLDGNKLKDFNAKLKEVEALDDQFENEAKAQANLNALSGNRVNAQEAEAAIMLGASVIGSIGNHTDQDDPFDSVEYKNAFMRHVLNSAPIPAKFANADANTKTSDVGSIIPTTTMQKIYEKMESIGMILPLVTHTSYKGGVSIPTSTVKPVASWVAEGKGTDRQKKSTGSITFSYFKLRCAISMSLETTVVSYPMFESVFVANVAEAMVKAKEQSIISGDGSGKPKGILAETPAAGQAIEVDAAGDISYKTLLAVEAALPQAYDGGAVWCMTKNTFINKVLGIVDDNKQPVCRTNYGLAGKPEYSILGRRAVLCGDYMSSYSDSPDADTIVAFLFNFKDYILNTNMGMTVKRYTDEDTDDEVMKAIELVDGKVVDKNSLVTLTKKKAAE